MVEAERPSTGVDLTVKPQGPKEPVECFETPSFVEIVLGGDAGQETVLQALKFMVAAPEGQVSEQPETEDQPAIRCVDQEIDVDR